MPDGFNPEVLSDLEMAEHSELSEFLGKSRADDPDERDRETGKKSRAGSKKDRGAHPTVDSLLHTTGAYSDNWGDIFTVWKLFQLAGADLDKDYNMDGWTTRQAGTALEVSAVYNNLYPFLSTFGYKPVRYHYEVHELMLPYMMRTILSDEQPDDFPHRRRVEHQYGLLLHFKVSGTFGFFNVVYLILMLTTAFALITSATTITDLYYLYVKRSDNFFHLKYEVSPDFSDMWKCKKCGHRNEKEDDTCKGVPEWMDPRTTEVCGAETTMWKCKTCGHRNYEDDYTCKGVPEGMDPRTTPVCGAERPPRKRASSEPEPVGDDDSSGSGSMQVRHSA